MRKPVLRRGKTIWLNRDRGIRGDGVLRGHHQTDVAIVGGGMTGAMIAEAFTRIGVDVIVVEASRCGHGSTAASTALLLQEPDYDLAALSRKYGAKDARRIWELSRDAAREFIDLIHRLRIRCSLRELGSIYYTLDEARAALLRRELRRRQAVKLGGRWLSASSIERTTGFRGAGAIRTAGNALLDPLAACLGLLQVAKRRGARIFQRSRITRIDRVGDGVRLRSTHGTIDARQVVVATGYATRYFRPLAGRFRLRRTYVITTNRMTAAQRRRIGLRAVMLWDTARPYHYVRWVGDRLLLGGEDHPSRPGARPNVQFARATNALAEYFTRLYPSLNEVGFDTGWEGLFAMTPDSLPYIGSHRRYPHHAFALGYGGNGMTFAALAARILVEQWQGHHSPDHKLFAFNRHS